MKPNYYSSEQANHQLTKSTTQKKQKMNTIPREATVVANCNVWAFSSIMTGPLAILA
jgi:hypothetical protein